MSTSNPHVDPASAWLTGDHSTPSYKPPETQLGDVEADTVRATQEVRRNAERDEQIERARPDNEYHIARHGNLADAFEFDRAASQGLRDPDRWHGTATHLYRTFAKTPPAVLPAKEPEAEPPDYLDDRAKDDWHREQAAARAYRDVPREKAYREQVKAAAPQIAQMAADHPNTPLDQLIAQGAAAKQAMETRPEIAFKLAKYGAAPADEQQAQERQQHEQRLTAREQWLDQTGVSALPEEVQEHMAAFIGHLNKTKQRTGDDLADLRVAHQYATEKLQEKAAAEQAKVAAEQAKAAAAKARQAARSISGSSSGSDVRERDVSGGSLEFDVRDAWRSLTANNRV